MQTITVNFKIWFLKQRLDFLIKKEAKKKENENFFKRQFRKIQSMSLTIIFKSNKIFDYQKLHISYF